MQMMRTENWFKRLRTLAMLAVFCLFASPVLASSCCCDAMFEADHSHFAVTQAPASPHDHDAHDHDSNASLDAPTQIGATTAAQSVRGVCAHTQCEVASLVIGDNSNKSAFFAPIAMLVVKPFAFQTPHALAVTTFPSRVARPRAPDRFSSSGLSPPAFQQS